MLAAAPMLMGHDAHYGKRFFTACVGLCASVKGMPKNYSFITDEMITEIWPIGPQSNMYKLSRCRDNEHVKKFGKQYFEVYGNKPDNCCYSMRFLKACFATLVFEKSVNWCAEAQARHKLRM